MAFPNIKQVIAFFIMMCICRVSIATVYKVGDEAGWTSMGRVNYQRWSVGKTFHVGDVLFFNYNNQFHNVEQVNKGDYENCNATSPIATYTNGSDSINLDKEGQVYFICGFQKIPTFWPSPSDCVLGQKVDIFVSPGAS
ncbi:Mavicyanin [Euphorbia peplus]|nr:Mavicyanin [Euphorbia peplus]